MGRDLNALIIAAAVAMPLAYAQAPQANTAQTRSNAQAGGQENKKVTRGRVKEYVPGQRITIDIPRAFDRTYNLERPPNGQRITVAPGLDPGRRVAIIESEREGVDYIRIVPDGAEAAMADGSFTPKVAATGKVVRMTPGRAISVTLDSGAQRTFDLQKAGAGPRVLVAQGVSLGDTVQVLEGQENGKKVVWIDKPPAAEADRRAAPGAAAPATDEYGPARSRRKK